MVLLCASARASNPGGVRRPEFAMGPPLPLPLLLLVLLLALLPSPPAAAAAGGLSAWGALRGAAGSRRASPAEQEAAAAGVLRRLLPSHARSFSFQIDSKVGGSGCSYF